MQLHRATVTRRAQLLAQATARVLYRALAQSYGAWRAHLAERLAHRAALVARALARFSNALGSVVFEAWLEWIGSKRAILARATYAIGPGRLKARCLRSWVASVREAVKERQTQELLGGLQLIGKDWLVQVLGHSASPGRLSAPLPSSSSPHLSHACTDPSGVHPPFRLPTPFHTPAPTPADS